MKKLIKLIFGDLRNAASVAVALAAAYATFRWQPEPAGWLLAVLLLGAAAWQTA